MGMMLRNLPPPGDIANHIETEVSSTLRKIALTVILTRAGLEINPEVFAVQKRIYPMRNLQTKRIAS